MKHPNFFIKAALVVACLLCSMSAAAQEAYACITPEDSTMTFYYDNLRSTRPGTTYNADNGNNRARWNSDGSYLSVARVVFDPSFAGTTNIKPAYWFYNMKNLTEIIGMEYLNTSQVTTTHWMFYGCEKLRSIDLSHFSTESLTNMSRMFGGCKSLESLDLSHFNTENVTDMSNSFAGC